MTATQDAGLLEEALDYILTMARDPDFEDFFNGLQANFKARRLLAIFFIEHMDEVRIFRPNDPLCDA
jgi:aminopeptidase 2